MITRFGAGCKKSIKKGPTIFMGWVFKAIIKKTGT
jgi:hypothetical protein